MHVTTTRSLQVWASPDGSRKIWDVQLKTPDGKDYPLQTFSDKIAVVGFSGDVETYVGTKGQKFARQKPKEQAHIPNAAPTSNTREWVDHSDDIKAQFAIKQAVQLYLPKVTVEGKPAWAELEEYAMIIFSMIARVKSTIEQPKTLTTLDSVDDEYKALERGLMGDSGDGMDEINLADIPF